MLPYDFPYSSKFCEYFYSFRCFEIRVISCHFAILKSGCYLTSKISLFYSLYLKIRKRAEILRNCKMIKKNHTICQNKIRKAKYKASPCKCSGKWLNDWKKFKKTKMIVLANIVHSCKWFWKNSFVVKKKEESGKLCVRLINH